MKLLLSFLCLTSLAFGQEKVDVRKSTWAGGICCSNGVDVQVSLPNAQLIYYTDSIVVDIPGTTFLLNEKDFLTYKNTYNSFVSLGWNNSRTYTMVLETTYKGIPEAQFRVNNFSQSRCILYYKDGTTLELPVELKEEIIAYP